MCVGIPMASNNMYRVGDFVYFESSATAPYQIRRIDELNKTPTGAVEAKVACYFRRRDVSIALINQAEKYYLNDTDSDDETIENNVRFGKRSVVSVGNSSNGNPGLTDVGKHRIKHRELFLSRQTELLPATHIRGKCSVTLYNDAEPLSNYLAREDAFYYKLIYDPVSKTLQEDRGAMRIGSDHQSDIQPLLKPSENDPRFSANLEQLVWKPGALTDEEIDMFCTLTRAVGTLGRAYDSSSAIRQPLLLDAAASAGRDITKQHAHDLLHKANYDMNKAIGLLLPHGQPVVCRDQLEDWSANEAHLFEDALDKYSKVFPDILSDYLSWKTPKALIELYYYWKTTDRYVRQRRTKMAAQEHRLKQVYIPNYSKPNPSVLYTGPDKTGRGCEGCAVTTSSQWYAWGPQNLSYRLCTACWNYWKRYGGLKNSSPKERATLRNSQPNAPNSSTVVDAKPTGILGPNSFPAGIAQPGLNSPGSSLLYPDGVSIPTVLSGGPRGTQCFKTPSLIRLARILCPHLVRPARLARRPGKPASTTADKKGKTGSDILDTSPTTVSFSTLRNAVQPILSRISDPSSLLYRPHTMHRVDNVVLTLASRKGITLYNTDLSNRLSNSVPLTNGPVPITKRPRSPNQPEPKHQLNGLDSISHCETPSSDPLDLVNGSKSRIRIDDDGSPPCKKSAVEACSPISETSNGLVIVDSEFGDSSESQGRC